MSKKKIFVVSVAFRFLASARNDEFATSSSRRTTHSSSVGHTILERKKKGIKINFNAHTLLYGSMKIYKYSRDAIKHKCQKKKKNETLVVPLLQYRRMCVRLRIHCQIVTFRKLRTNRYFYLFAALLLLRLTRTKLIRYKY